MNKDRPTKSGETQMSDTPRTDSVDKALCDATGNYEARYLRMTDFARDLEGELRALSNSEQPKGCVVVPREALLWLMGAGDSFSAEGKRGAFWWRSEFCDRAGIDMRDLLAAAPASPAPRDERDAKDAERYRQVREEFPGTILIECFGTDSFDSPHEQRKEMLDAAIDTAMQSSRKGEERG